MAAVPVEFALDGWRVLFRPRSATLDCRHRGTGVRIRAACHVRVRRADRDEAWRVAAPLDTAPNRLALLDPAGLCQGYLALGTDGGDLRLLMVERALLQYTGQLTVDARVTAGRAAYACRTRPPVGKVRVLQMASGPADSGLNDTVFDPRRDLAVQFEAEQVAVATEPTAAERPPVFRVRLQAVPERPGAAGVAFRLRPGYYRSRWVPWYKPLDRRRCPTAPTGWMSWNVYFDQAGEEENLAEARVAAQHLLPFGLRIWSIESWQDFSDAQPVAKFANLTLRPHPRQFPHGMPWLAARLRELGFRPGIWSVPFGTGDEAFYRQHRAWFLHAADGTPLRNWCGLYLVDPSQPAVRRYLEHTCRVMARDWGYEFLKIDGMSAWTPHYTCHFYEQPHVRAAFRRPCANPYQRCVQALRRGIGPDALLLACAGAYSSPEAATADAARIGHDVVEMNKPPRWHNYLNQVTTTLANLFTNNVVWYTDPDTLLVGAYAEESVARLAATVVALPGQLTFSGDKLGELPPDRMRLLQRCLPACDVRPLDLYPVYDPCPIWTLKVRRPFAAWDVVSLFNFHEQQAAEIGCELSELGLDPAGEYLVYDAWARRLLAPVRGALRQSVPPRANALLVLHPRLDRPQFLASDRHLTQGAVGLLDLAWDAATATLRGCSELVAADPQTLVFTRPPGWRCLGVTSAASACTVTDGHGTLDVTLCDPASGPAEWSLRWAGPEQA